MVGHDTRFLNSEFFFYAMSKFWAATFDYLETER